MVSLSSMKAGALRGNVRAFPKQRALFLHQMFFLVYPSLKIMRWLATMSVSPQMFFRCDLSHSLDWLPCRTYRSSHANPLIEERRHLQDAISPATNPLRANIVRAPVLFPLPSSPHIMYLMTIRISAHSRFLKQLILLPIDEDMACPLAS
jgi:hypothetical protein